jgi:acyl carrier protein
LGLDSLGALELVFEIEEEFKVKVPDDQIRDLRTVRAVCDGVEALRNA